MSEERNVGQIDSIIRIILGVIALGSVIFHFVGQSIFFHLCPCGGDRIGALFSKNWLDQGMPHYVSNGSLYRKKRVAFIIN